MFLNEKRESYLSILAAEFRPDQTIKGNTNIIMYNV